MSPRRTLPLLLLAAILAGRPAGAQTWSLSGPELRERHADTLEDLLRELPLLRVDRFGASGLPFRVALGTEPLKGFLLVVDDLPQRDAWSGENLYEEIPLSLLERVEVDLRPAQLEYGAAAAAGVLRIWTRRPEAPKVATRIHLSRGSFTERGRRLSFETPPGVLAVSVGLDEFFGDGYRFAEVWGGEGSPASAQPEVGVSRRRGLVTRLDLDGARLGPVALQLLQTGWRMELGAENELTWNRDLHQLTLSLPDSPLGRITAGHRMLGRRGWHWRSENSSLHLHWRLPTLLLRGGALSIFTGAEKHQPGLLADGSRVPLERPSRLWLAARWASPAYGRLALRAGARAEGEWRRSPRLLYQARLAWTLSAEGGSCGLFLAGGPDEEPWRHDRLPGLSLWPQGITEPLTSSTARTAQRTGLWLDLPGELAWAGLRLYREDGAADWTPYQTGEGEYAWARGEPGPRHHVSLDLGTYLRSRLGTADARLSLLAALGESLSASLQAGHPRSGRLDLRLSRPFFRSDARLTLRGGLEYRGGLEGQASLWRIDLGAELRVIDARFWLRLRNALNAVGEEIPSFPMPPSTLQMGIDWQLDH